MRTLFIPLIASIFLASCDNQSSEQNPDINLELEKWKKELQINGEVGPPCYDIEKWAEENPSTYWGMQEIETSNFDINTDGVIDGLYYFPAENCLGATVHGSHFAVFIYSYDGSYLTNKNITTTIEQQINSDLSLKGVDNINYTILTYEKLDKFIKGHFSTMRNNDYHCCPSISGTFEYDPFRFEIALEYEDVQKNRR
jgi:hypothetical protein